MSAPALRPVRGRPLAILVVAVSAAVLLGALAFQYIGDLPPCPLCHDQRYPYIATIVLGVLAFFAGGRLRAALILLAAAGFAVTAGLGAFHAGVEYKWWPGPSTCSGGFGLDAVTPEDLLAALPAGPVVACDAVPWELFGISLAGFNFLIAGAMTLICLVAGIQLWRRR